jgi:hypothetical protein
MARTIGAVVAGWIVVLALGGLCNLLALQFWPAYAAVYPERAFTLPMQVTRLGLGALVVVITGFVVAKIGRDGIRAVLWCTIIALVETVWAHLHEPIWSHYPPWYHFVTFCIPVPCALLGAWLQRTLANKQAG